MNNKILFILFFVVVVLAGVAIGFKDKFQLRNAEKVAAEYADFRSITEVVSANGKIYPEKEVKLSVEVPGEVTRINVKEGDSVQKGALLLEINPSTFVTSVSRAKAAHNQALANLSGAKARNAQANAQFNIVQKDYNRKIELFNQGVLSAFEFEQIESAFMSSTGEKEAAFQNVEASKFQVQSALASLKEANENLSRTKLFAPISGIVSKLNVELGEKVVGTGQMAGTELITIADLNQMELLVDVGENDVLRISKGDTAEIEVDAYLDDTFMGVVSHIAYSSNALLEQQITKFEVRIKLLPSSYSQLVQPDKGHAFPFRPGMSATADIITNRKDNILSVPIQSVTLRAKDEEGESLIEEKDQVVFVVEDGMVTTKEVKTSIQDDKYIEITEGIDDSTMVVTGPFKAISKGLENKDKVIVVEESELFSED